MILFSRLCFIFLCLHGVLNAARWPWLITSVSSPLSSEKRVIRSRKSFNKKIVCDRLDYLFSSCSFCAHFERVEELSALEEILQQARDKRSMVVHVLLAECDAASLAQWRFTSDQGFTVQAIKCNDGKQKKTVQVAGFAVMVKHGSVFYNGKRLKHAVRLSTTGGHGEFNGVPYDGDFCIVPHKDKFLCINCVGLEDYVSSVLKTESWPGWPLEVNKVFAIACRSYVAYKVLEAKRSGRPYHVKNSNAHQTYRGRHTTSLLKTAVEQTKGIVMGFEGKPILAMFDCCCGGVIPAHIADFDFYKVPYLARTYACHHCKESSLYAWQVSYEQALFDGLLQDYKSEILKLHDIHIIEKDKAGLVMQVGLKGPKKHTVISGKKLYSLLKEVKSFYFDVQKKAGQIVFSGRGFGHHIGLCQWGARQMVRDGCDYKSILRFYYPGAYFMRLS